MLSIFIGPADLRWRRMDRTKHDFYHLPEYVVLCGKYEDSEPLASYADEGEAACVIFALLMRMPGHRDARQLCCVCIVR